MTNRRNVLLGLGGVVALAGCTEFQQGEVQEDDQRDTENESQGDEAQQPENESRDKETQQSDEADRIERVAPQRQAIEDALQTYVEFLDDEDADILAVTSLSEEFDHLPVVNTIGTVRQDLTREARREPDEEISAKILVLRREARLIEAIARAQNYGQQTAESARSYVGEMDRNSQLTRIHSTLVDRTGSFAESVTTVSSQVERLSSPRVNDVELYEAKAEQFENELENLRHYAAIHSDYQAGKNSLDQGFSQLESENYSSAEASAGTAVERFDVVLDELSGTTDELQPLTDEMVSQVESDRETAKAVRKVTAALSN